MKVYYDKDCDLSIIQGKKVAIIGYGSQGHAQACNLKDSGVDVTVGLRKGSATVAKAEAHGLKVADVATAVAAADLVMILTPDEFQGQLYKNEIEPNIKKGATLAFAHGFAIHFNQVVPRADLLCPLHDLELDVLEGGLASREGLELVLEGLEVLRAALAGVEPGLVASSAVSDLLHVGVCAGKLTLDVGHLGLRHDDGVLDRAQPSLGLLELRLLRDTRAGVGELLEPGVELLEVEQPQLHGGVGLHKAPSVCAGWAFHSSRLAPAAMRAPRTRSLTCTTPRAASSPPWMIATGAARLSAYFNWLPKFLGLPR